MARIRRTKPAKPKWHQDSKPVRIRRLTALGYLALVIGVRRAHLSAGWMRHFKARSDRFFDLATKEWSHA